MIAAPERQNLRAEAEARALPNFQHRGAAARPPKLSQGNGSSSQWYRLAPGAASHRKQEDLPHFCREAAAHVS